MALKPGAYLTHIVWRRREDNPAWQIAKDITLRHLPPPGDDADTGGPGPFSMADQETVKLMMKGAGYEDISFKQVDEKIMVGRTPEECIAFALTIGPPARCSAKPARIWPKRNAPRLKLRCAPSSRPKSRTKSASGCLPHPG